VRNWARVEIGVLSLLRNIFFNLWGDFPNSYFSAVLARASSTSK
jgi:hypothetical protein